MRILGLVVRCQAGLLSAWVRSSSQQFLTFLERVWLKPDSTFPKPNQITLCNLQFVKKTSMATPRPCPYPDSVRVNAYFVKKAQRLTFIIHVRVLTTWLWSELKKLNSAAFSMKLHPFQVKCWEISNPMIKILANVRLLDLFKMSTVIWEQ